MSFDYIMRTCFFEYVLTLLGAAITAFLIILVFFIILDPLRYIRSKKKEKQEEEKKLRRSRSQPLSRMSLYLRRPFNRSSISPKNESMVHPYNDEIPLEPDKRSVSFSVDPPTVLDDGGGTPRRGGMDDYRR